MVTIDPATALQRVLLLERQQGFANRAAVGGLTAFARHQLERAGHPPPAALAAAVPNLDGYDNKDRRGREQAISAAIDALLTGGRRPADGTVSQAKARPETSVRPTTAPPSRPAPRPKLTVVRQPEDLDLPVASLKGMRKATADALLRQGVVTVRDLLFYFPRDHYDYTDTSSISRMRLGQKMTLVGTIADVRTNRTLRGAAITTATVTDQSGTTAVRWFNQPYLAKQLPIGARIAISGEPEVFNGRFFFQPRDFELIESADPTHTARLVPIYPLTKGLFQRSLRQLIKRLLDEFTPVLEDFLPDAVRRAHHLPDLSMAVAHYHFPDDFGQKERCQQRLAFDELLLIQLGLLRRKRDWQIEAPEAAVVVDDSLHEAFCRSLPFRLTAAQERAIGDIFRDLARPAPMSRLLEGDVGSGKTVVAAAALLQVVRSGRQAVLMAPTEILAEQHHRTLSQLLAAFDIPCEILIGSTPRARRKQLHASLRAGDPQVIVGTHALIQQDVAFTDLGLAITDEQHRFGVEQRAVLRQKGLHPHILAMTATPIPRTLALTIYGDLDVTVIDELPPGRKPPITTWSRTPAEAYGVVRDEVRKGRQAFIICPVIEESADSDMRSVMAEHRELQGLTFADLNVGLLHGRMKPAEKEATLQQFRAGDTHILVATSVVEVGIDVPNATVMVIRDAHRFGLAQLHQFRGRVGRGGDQAYCVLLSAAEGDDARERLEALTATENGFELAEEDLRLRGPGEFWGTRQSGLPELRVAQLGDVATIALARQAAYGILDADPDLCAPENAALRARVDRFWAISADLS